MTLELVVVEGAEQAERISVRAGLVIGRRSDCDLTLANDTVSGRHARIVEADGGFAVEDMGSQNKTVVQGGPTLTKGVTHPLSSGMTLLLGKVKLRLEGGESAGDMPTMRQTDDPGPTMADPGATMADPGATMRNPGQDARGDSAVIPDWRMERPEDATTQAVPTGGAPKAATPQAQEPAAVPDAGEFVTMGLSPDMQGGAFEDLASQAALEAFRPRIVIDSDLARQIVDIRSPEFTIGREGCNMNIAHGAVSGVHAKIVFDPTHKRLRLVDLGSKNFTFLSGELVSPEVPREIAPHSHLRVGPIDLLFVIDKNYDGEAVPTQVLETAAEMLEADGSITREQRAKAAESAKADKRHIGEMLILSGAIDAKRWVRALDHAELSLVTRSLPNPELQRLRLAVMALGVAVVVLFVLVFVL